MTTRNTLTTILLAFAITACVPPVDEPGDDKGGTTNGDGNGDGDGDGDGNGGGGGGGATASQVIEKISDTECDQAHTCKASFPTDFGGTFAEVFGNSPAECYPLNAAYWNADAVEAGIEAGKIMFDQAAADECMAVSVDAPVCSTFWNEGPGVPDACWGVFAGTVAQGGACQSDFECSGGTYCGETGTCAADTGN